MYIIGTIVNTHGIKGEVKIKQHSDFDERFEQEKSMYIQLNGKEHTLTIEKSRKHKNVWIIAFNGFNSISEVEGWKGKDVYIKADQQQTLEEHAFYYHEIIGCEVATTEGEWIGKVDSILSPGANDVWVVRSENNKEILIPYIADVVKSVDVTGKIITIELMEGLID